MFRWMGKTVVVCELPALTVTFMVKLLTYESLEATLLANLTSDISGLKD